MDEQVISVRGAREHNLKNVDIDVPKNKLVVVTGVSGSGKSSLAFDTLFAEGQRRYIESLSAYARQFLGQLQKPTYDAIRGLSPTIAIEQKTSSMNPRSTVGTVTEVHDYLRVLFARAGTPHCPDCGDEVRALTSGEIVDAIAALPQGSRWTLLAPIVAEGAANFQALVDEVRRMGFVRLRVDGETLELHDVDGESSPARVEVVVDRIKISEDMRSRLNDSVETALRVGEGVVFVAPHASNGGAAETSTELTLSQRRRCDRGHGDLPELTPQLFSFNSPQGMCPDCRGLGYALEVDEDKIVPDASLSLDTGAVVPWAMAFGEGDNGSLTGEIVRAVCKTHKIDSTAAWSTLTATQRNVLIDGAVEPVKFTSKRSYGSVDYELKFEGLAPMLKRRWRQTKSEAMRQKYEAFMSSSDCRSCEGTRLRREARHVLIDGVSLDGLGKLSIHALDTKLRSLELTGRAEVVGRDTLREVLARVGFLANVGLGYLSLGRGAGTLSGGESQRIRLASQIGTELTGVLYVLDEPSIGLHPRDNTRLIDALKRLRDIGNSVVIVEHDESIMRAADWLIDVGPGAGVHGGEIIAQGTPSQVENDPASVTGAYLSGAKRIQASAKRRKPTGWVEVLGARANNLRGIDVKLPVGVFGVVTGVSGAGKSSLINGIVLPALKRSIYRSAAKPGPHDRIRGLAAFDKVVTIDQRPIGRSPRSNPATYTKLFGLIRTLFARTKEANMYGYAAGRFSFNVKGGRCEACQGDGVEKVEMHFLADVYVTCERCKGKRFNDATLRVTYKGASIADVLDMSIDYAAEFFANHKKISRILDTLVAVGLGYVCLGQSATTLSGGEAQRIKLSRELARVQTGRTVYLLDEPSTGLHFADIERLLAVVARLVDSGNTVWMVEHDLDIIKSADWVVDLGPEGGDGGGTLVAAGPPEEVAKVADSHTGRWLSEVLAQASR